MTAEIIDFSSRLSSRSSDWGCLLQMAREPETGVYADNCASGRRLAEAVAAYVIANDYPPAIGHIAGCLTGGAPLAGRRVGFFHRLAEMLMSRVKAEPAPPFARPAA